MSKIFQYISNYWHLQTIRFFKGIFAFSIPVQEGVIFGDAQVLTLGFLLFAEGNLMEKGAFERILDINMGKG